MSCWFGACASARCCCSLHCSFCTYAPRVCWAVGPARWRCCWVRPQRRFCCMHPSIIRIPSPRPFPLPYCTAGCACARPDGRGRPGRGPLAAVFVLGVLGTLLKVTVVIMVIAVVLDWMHLVPKAAGAAGSAGFVGRRGGGRECGQLCGRAQRCVP